MLSSVRYKVFSNCTSWVTAVINWVRFAISGPNLDCASELRFQDRRTHHYSIFTTLTLVVVLG
jgi:hypothetical protein